MNTTFDFAPVRMTSPDLSLDEGRLVCLSQAGDAEMFGILYDRYINRIYRYIYYRVADGDMADDLTSVVFLKVWENLPKYTAGKSPFIAWLYRIAHNAVIDHYRTRKVSVSLNAVSPEIGFVTDFDERLELQCMSQQILDAMSRLPKQQRQVLVLRFVKGLDTRDIARRLGKKQGAIRALQMRALQGLAKYMA